MPPTTSRRAAATAARRAQIIAASIATIAELGYRRTTFGRIAERGGLSSTRLISYHFASKDDLVAAVVADIFTSINEFLIDRAREDPATRPLQNPPDTVQRPRNSSGADELRAYITGVVAFVDAHRVRMRALQSIFAAVHDEPRNAAAYSPDTDRGVLGHIEDILRHGQARGEFRAFDTFTMAAAIQRSLGGLPLLLQTKPDLDLRDYATELVTLFDLATRHPNHKPDR
ncbi:TetR/AcrR family transcriptional regulator [Nocardia sp. NBC_00508]|uniref:TetR/AcrR family transcriptional regulator n=1 Tax=Nocardia sp. NBC_00508 TaxID=2975992 RepID=UPI002E809976|nr:helix-turn-helix domain-containing protein [Nocardia sp. NBC_00508]WUD66098.1 TetR/AcrR family transcriptional regulator [Nocardia sp. NBC_00508]